MVMKCDNCHKLFYTELSLNNIIIDDIKVYYIECPHCNKKYISDCEDEILRKLKKKYSKLKQRKRKKDLMQQMRLHQQKIIQYMYNDNFFKE